MFVRVCVCVLCFLLASHSLSLSRPFGVVWWIAYNVVYKLVEITHLFIRLYRGCARTVCIVVDDDDARIVRSFVCVCVRSMMQPKAYTIFRLDEQAILGQYYTGAHNSHSDLCALFTN